MKHFETISELRAKNEQIGNYFFSRQTMRFFKTKIESAILEGDYFITSETNHNDTKREFTIRQAKETGEIINNPFDCKFRTKSDAKEYLKEQLYLKSVLGADFKTVLI